MIVQFLCCFLPIQYSLEKKVLLRSLKDALLCFIKVDLWKPEGTRKSWSINPDRPKMRSWLSIVCFTDKMQEKHSCCHIQFNESFSQNMAQDLCDVKRVISIKSFYTFLIHLTKWNSQRNVKLSPNAMLKVILNFVCCQICYRIHPLYFSFFTH